MEVNGVKRIVYNPLVVILLLALLVTLPNALRPVPLGADSYYYLHYAGQPQPGMPVFFFYLAGINNVVVSFIVAVGVFALLWLIADELGVKEPTIAMALLCAAPGVIFRLADFEDDLVGILTALTLVFVFLRAEKDRRWWLLLLAMAPLGLLVWRGLAWFYLLIMFYELLKHGRWGWLLLPALLLFAEPDSIVGENSFGLLFVPIVLLGLVAGLKGWSRTPLFVKAWAAFFLALGLVQAKWLWLAAFPLALMLWDALKDQPRKKAMNIVLVFVVMGLAFGGYWVYKSQPSAAMMADFRDIHTIVGDAVVDNSWEYGHWLRYTGTEPANDNLRWNNYTLPEHMWNTEWALFHNSSANLTGYEPYKNYSWAMLYRKANASSL